MSAKKNRVDFPIYGTTDMIRSWLRVLNREVRHGWDAAATDWRVPEDLEVD